MAGDSEHAAHSVAQLSDAIESVSPESDEAARAARTITDSAQRSGHLVDELGRSGTDTSTIVATIALTGQTQLLALNAHHRGGRGRRRRPGLRRGCR